MLTHAPMAKWLRRRTSITKVPISNPGRSEYFISNLRRYTRFTKMVQIRHSLMSTDQIQYSKSIYRIKIWGHRENYGKKGV